MLVAGLLVSALLGAPASRSPNLDRWSPNHWQDALRDVATPGLNRYVFDDWGGPDIPVWVHVPEGVDVTRAPIMVIMHGMGRSAARYLSEWDQIADAQGFLIVAPEFTTDEFPGSRCYNLGRMRDEDDQPVKESLWSFSVIEPIVSDFIEKVRGQQKDFTLYGHSAGSQFVHRFLFFKPDAPVNRYLPANAGWYTMPDLEIPYPYGLGGTGVTKRGLKAALRKDVVILLGDADNNPKHSGLRRSKGAMRQGPHRFARGKSFYESGKRQAKALGVKFGWTLRVAPGVGHSNGNIGAAFGDLIGKSRVKRK